MVYYEQADANDNTVATNNLGHIYGNDFNEYGHLLLQKTIDLSDNDVKRSKASRSLARFYDRTEDYADAIWWYKEAIKVDCSGEANYDLADLYLDINNSKEAILYYEKAITFGHSKAMHPG